MPLLHTQKKKYHGTHTISERHLINVHIISISTDCHQGDTCGSTSGTA